MERESREFELSARFHDEDDDDDDDEENHFKLHNIYAW